ncbi:MAG: hypothetical protein HW412_445 [Bacteroidetes bacterium]|nr:hypothetical protein [Bacteroidota bacterium]
MVPTLTIGDKVLLALLVCLAAGSFLAVGSFAIEGNTVLVQVDGRTVHKASLFENRIFPVSGAEGALTIEIRGGRVAVTEAECPNHVCVRTGWRSRGGDVIVCVPNKVVVRILTADQAGVRAITV